MYVMYVFLFLIINKYNIRHSNTAIAHTAIYPIYFFTDKLTKNTYITYIKCAQSLQPQGIAQLQKHTLKVHGFFKQNKL